jgi:hypothetical protein
MATSASSNPITSVPIPSSSPITSVPYNTSPTPLYQTSQNNALLPRLNLDLRGTIFPVERETLMLLPESVLLGLFPQGLILSKPASWEGADDGVFVVDVSDLLSLCNETKHWLILLSSPSRYPSLTSCPACTETRSMDLSPCTSLLFGICI